jgi:hypothetical protein
MIADPDGRIPFLVEHLNRAADLAGTTFFNTDVMQHGDQLWLVALILDELVRIRVALEDMNERAKHAESPSQE